MPERRIRPRRPVAWNQLLRKSHAHTPSQSRRRHALRRSIADEADAYLEERAMADVDEQPDET